MYAQRLAAQLGVGKPLLYTETAEDWRVWSAVLALSSRLVALRWTVTDGLRLWTGTEEQTLRVSTLRLDRASPEDAAAEVNAILALLASEELDALLPASLRGRDRVVVLQDVVSEEPLPDPRCRLLKDLFLALNAELNAGGRRTTVLLTGVGWTPPAGVAGLVATLPLPLPGEPELAQIARSFRLPVTPTAFAARARGLGEAAAKGLCREIATVTTEAEAWRIVDRVKAASVEATGVLTIVPTGTPVELGGWRRFKTWFATRRPFFLADGSPAMRPRGVLLLGFPGTGKSHSARWIAQELGVPLVSLDLGAIQDRWVGSSEARMREALRTIEAAAPVVLFIDEIEKSVAGVGSDGTGVVTRLVGQLLRFLQDHDRPIFLVATCNKPDLPPELTRAGRFDAQFVVRPPSNDDRRQIVGSVARELDVAVEREVVEYIVSATGPDGAGFTGAELRQLVKEAVYVAGVRAPGIAAHHVDAALPFVQPLVSRPDGKTLLQRYHPSSLTGFQEV